MVRLEGLSQEEVAKKIQEGKQNKVTIKTEKSIGQIIRDNVFTYFNLIFLILAILLVAVKSWNNLLFVPIVVVNSLVGIVQEVRSRRILRQMQFLHISEAIVLREGKEETGLDARDADGGYLFTYKRENLDLTFDEWCKRNNKDFSWVSAYYYD